jgi:hypothetical protein
VSIKNTLISSTAALFVATGAHAADMPVKIKPAEFVKICTLYGSGFYYIPGTDTCIKIGGYLRVQIELHAGAGGVVLGSQQMAPQGRLTRDLSNDLNYRVRAVATFDARTQTEYGTLRSYIRAGWTNTTPTDTGGGTTAVAFWDRAFIQFAGFTVGRAYSFFDMFTYSSYAYMKPRTTGDTSLDAQNLWAFTVQFGNGVTYTLSLEDPSSRRFATVDTTCVSFFGDASPLQDNGLAINGSSCGSSNQFGFRVPDIITNLRVDQTWGYAGISTAIHDASGAYYQTPNNVNNGHPTDKFGWAFSASGQLNLTGSDTVGVNFVWAKGATGYATNSNWWQYYNNSNSRAMAWATDGIFSTGTDVELTEAWSINAGYQHNWGSAGTFAGKWKTSVYGGYVSISYNDNVIRLINQRFVAASFCNPGGAAPTLGTFTPLAGNSCSPNFSFYQVGSRTQFNPHALIDIGLDVTYTKINTAYQGPVNWEANGSRPACSNSAILSCTFDDQNVLSAFMRWQRNFYP